MKKTITTLLTFAFLSIGAGIYAQNLIDAWDGDPNGTANVITGPNSKPNDVGWGNTVSSIPWQVANGAGGCRFRDYNVTGGYTGFTNESDASTVTSRQLMLRFDNSAYSTSVYTYAVTLEACTSYTFSWDYVCGGSGTPPQNITVGISTTPDATGRLSSKVFTTTNSATVYRYGTYDFVSGSTAGTYYITINGASVWYGVNNLSIVKNNTQLLNVSASTLLFDEASSVKTFVVTGNSLAEDVVLTAPTGITLDVTSIAKADVQCGVTVTATFNKAATSAGEISIVSGTLSQTIGVITSVDSKCFTQLYAEKTNLVADPYMNSLTTFGGWGAKSIVSDPAVAFCGGASGLVSGGSIDAVLTGKLKVNTPYRVRAMVKASSTAARLGVFGYSQGQPDINVNATVVGEWSPIDFTFTTGATLGATHGVFFNNGPGSYIDNWEIYELIPVITVNETSVPEMAASVGNTDIETITISGVELTGNVTLAIVGADADQFSIDKVSIEPIFGSLAATEVTITYTPTSASTHTATLNVESAGAVSKVFELKGSSLATHVASSKDLGAVVTNKNGVVLVKTNDANSVVSVFDITGKMVSKNASSLNEQTIILSKPGVYMIKIDGNGQSKMFKVVKSN